MIYKIRYEFNEYEIMSDSFFNIDCACTGDEKR